MEVVGVVVLVADVPVVPADVVPNPVVEPVLLGVVPEVEVPIGLVVLVVEVLFGLAVLAVVVLLEFSIAVTLVIPVNVWFSPSLPVSDTRSR